MLPLMLGWDPSYKRYVVVVVVSHIQRIGCQEPSFSFSLRSSKYRTPFFKIGVDGKTLGLGFECHIAYFSLITEGREKGD